MPISVPLSSTSARPSGASDIAMTTSNAGSSGPAIGTRPIGRGDLTDECRRPTLSRRQLQQVHGEEPDERPVRASRGEDEPEPDPADRSIRRQLDHSEPDQQVGEDPTGAARGLGRQPAVTVERPEARPEQPAAVERKGWEEVEDAQDQVDPRACASSAAKNNDVVTV
jgi:hypothetical protein